MKPGRENSGGRRQYWDWLAYFTPGALHYPDEPAQEEKIGKHLRVDRGRNEHCDNNTRVAVFQEARQRK
jgi:hypothetical protein